MVRLYKNIYISFFLIVASTALSYAVSRVETFNWEGGVKLEVTITPSVIDLAGDTEVVLSLEYPGAMSVSLPQDLSTRFEGFTIEGTYSPEKVSAGALSKQSTHVRLRPVPTAERYRIKPLAVEVVDTSFSQPQKSWHPTRQIIIETKSQTADVQETVSANLSPIYIRPSFKVVLKIGLIVAIAAVVIIALYFIASAIRMRQKIKKMSPKERAFFELANLLKKKLPEKGLFKDFYVELSMVIRRYIERRYGIRAPEQTTEEFLSVAKIHPSFTEGTTKSLEAFLCSADLIKFATASASVSTASEAAESAKSYIENDSGNSPLKNTEDMR